MFQINALDCLDQIMRGGAHYRPPRAAKRKIPVLIELKL